jgi:hypothetical protein
MATSALFVRETINLADDTEQRLLSFARSRQLQPGDTLIVAAFTMTAPADYVLDMNDPADPAYLLNVALVADTLKAPGLVLDMTGADAPGPAQTGKPGRSARIVARHLPSAVIVRADGGDGGAGLAGAPGVDETFTIEWDPQGHPHREYEPPTPGQPGGDGGAGGNGGTARVLWSTGTGPEVSAAGGGGGAAGKGGAGGKGAKTPQGRSRPNAPDGQDGHRGSAGLAGAAVVERAASVDDFWVKARGELGVELLTSARHWLEAAKYHFRQAKGLPTPEEANTVLDLLGLSAAADPSLTEVISLKTQLLSGDNLLGLPRNLDVLPDFERFLRRIDTYGRWVDGLMRDVNDLLAATSGTELTDAQLQVQLNTVDFTQAILQDALVDAKATLASATAEENGAVVRWNATMAIVDRRKADLDKEVDWGSGRRRRPLRPGWFRGEHLFESDGWKANWIHPRPDGCR